METRKTDYSDVEIPGFSKSEEKRIEALTAVKSQKKSGRPKKVVVETQPGTTSESASVCVQKCLGNVELKYYLLSEDATPPAFATEASACFDLLAKLKAGDIVKFYKGDNTPIDVQLKSDGVSVGPLERILVPTGIQMQIPKGHSLRVHIRSGVAFKRGLVLVNSEGVIDEDYTDELFLPIVNNSQASVVIRHGDRLAQAELVKDLRVLPEYSDIKIDRKTDRKGGIGSTGE